MAGSTSIQLKELRVRLSGTVGNRNFGNLNPEVSLTFSTEGVENWDEAIQQCIGVAHDAFTFAAAEMLSGYQGAREAEDMLQELGVRVATQVVPLVDVEFYDFSDFPDISEEREPEDDDTQEVDASKFLNL